jgi:hypothetical protein
MRTLLLLLALAGCADQTCADCVRRCAPFAVTQCNVWTAFFREQASCACDAARRAEQ